MSKLTKGSSVYLAVAKYLLCLATYIEKDSNILLKSQQELIVLCPTYQVCMMYAIFSIHELPRELYEDQHHCDIDIIIFTFYPHNRS